MSIPEKATHIYDFSTGYKGTLGLLGGRVPIAVRQSPKWIRRKMLKLPLKQRALSLLEERLAAGSVGN